MKSRKLISTGSSFEEKVGYSRAVVDGDTVYVSGCTGYDYDKMTISKDVVEQTQQCFVNITNVLEQAGATLEDVVRVLYIFPDRNDFEKCWPVLHKYFGEIKPACTMFSAGLANDDMKVEIEVTAKLK